MSGPSEWNDLLLGTQEAYNLFGSMSSSSVLSYDANGATMRIQLDRCFAQVAAPRLIFIVARFCSARASSSSARMRTGTASSRRFALA